MEQAKKYICACAITIIIVLTTLLSFNIHSKNSIERKWKDAMENVKSYSEQISNSENKNRAFKVTINQLKCSKDSIFKELNNTRNELSIKDSKLRNLQCISSEFTKADTITLPDTVFNDTQIDIDTLLSDEWYSMKVKMKYPSTVIVKPEFRSIKHIIVSTRRETVNPPKKFFLLRWFQKKQTILNVDVIEKNPYVQNQNSRYVEIVK